MGSESFGAMGSESFGAMGSESFRLKLLDARENGFSVNSISNDSDPIASFAPNDSDPIAHSSRTRPHAKRLGSKDDQASSGRYS